MGYKLPWLVIGNYALSWINLPRNLVNTRLQIDNKNKCDHCVYDSIKTIKYLNGRDGEWLCPHISCWMHISFDATVCPPLYPKSIAHDNNTIHPCKEFIPQAHSIVPILFKSCSCIIFTLVHFLIIWRCANELGLD